MTTVKSLNFGFLRNHDPLLELYAARAERYVFDDPNTSVIKLRQFAELLARHAAAFHGIETTDDDFRQTIGIIRSKRLGPREIVDLFDHLRLKGNEAVHEGTSDRSAALAGLITANRLAGWFQRTFVDRDFKPVPFKPPPNPVSVADSLRQELDSLREEAARYQQALAETQGEVSQLATIRNQMERQAEQYQQELVAVEAQLIASEQAQNEERESFERQLRQLAKQAASKPAAELSSIIERSERAAKDLGLDRKDWQHVPLAQMRLLGPGTSYCHKSPKLLVQSMKGGFVTANCSVCGSSSSVGEQEFYDLDLWVSCPKCRKRMTATKLWSNYGFECPECKWRCLLASLLPQWDELV